MYGFSARYRPEGAVFDVNGMSAFPAERPKIYAALLNSVTSAHFLSIINPTIAFQVGDIARIPVIDGLEGEVAERAVELAELDWNARETAWAFERYPLLELDLRSPSLGETYAELIRRGRASTAEMQCLEEANNRLFIDAYGLADELTPNVPLNEITLTCNPHYRYDGHLAEAERDARLLADTMRELVSYGVGLMMGRYSLAEPGLIYAHAGNEGFDPARYGAFPADEDGIVPITEEAWFAEDAATLIEQFLAIAWPEAPINETLATLTDGLTQGKGGEPRAALRAYLARTFYKDHLQTYRNRPIYWLFSSGKQKAFECLVYLHRYNESTLARMRTAYVTPLMGKMQQRISDLDVEIAGSASSAEKTRKGRDRDKTVKQLVELRAFDEELRHLADQRIVLDLDDGVKVNYGRFGTLLAAKDKVCGKDNDKDD